MPSPEMGLNVSLVKTDVSEEHIACINRVKRICELGTLAVNQRLGVKGVTC
jgi:hypothetical protein